MLRNVYKWLSLLSVAGPFQRNVVLYNEACISCTLEWHDTVQLIPHQLEE